MNNRNLMISRNGQALAEYEKPEEKPAGIQDLPGYANSPSMMRRKGPAPAEQKEKAIPGTEPAHEAPAAPAPEKQLPVNGAAAKAAHGTAADALKAKTEALKQKTAGAAAAAKAGTAPPPAKPAAQPKPAPVPQRTQAAKPAWTPGSIEQARTPDELAGAYIGMFRDAFGLELSPAICFENMRRLCEADTKDPAKTLYFIENTYRVSTILYLAGNLPILVVSSILAEKNRKNILKYVMSEVDNGSKPYDELRALRIRRWSRKFENMRANDAMTVTPGATRLSGPLAAAAEKDFSDICASLRKFNKELTGIVAKFDDATRNDITYIYSNWWYLLQGFENVPEMRTYVMAITDDTRRNLKL